MKESMGMISGKPMTREEAMGILNIEEAAAELDEDNFEATLDPKVIMERFETLIEKNNVEKGGSFYL